MFLKELWSFNKWLALLFILFLVSWGFINYKMGAVAAPLFQYGMYGGKFSVKDTQSIVELHINDKKLDLTKYSVVERDRIQVSLENYMIQEQTNKTFFLTMRRILSKAYIGNWMKEEEYTNNITNAKFTGWYKKMLEKITGEPVSKLEVYRRQYVWLDGSLQPVSPPSKIACIVAD